MAINDDEKQRQQDIHTIARGVARGISMVLLVVLASGGFFAFIGAAMESTDCYRNCSEAQLLGAYIGSVFGTLLGLFILMVSTLQQTDSPSAHRKPYRETKESND